MFAALIVFLFFPHLPSSPQHPPHLSIFLPLWFHQIHFLSPWFPLLPVLSLSLSMSVFSSNSQPSPFLCFSLIKKKCQTSLETEPLWGREPQIEERKWDHLSLRRPLRGIEKKDCGTLSSTGSPFLTPPTPKFFLGSFVRKNKREKKKKLPLHLTPNLLDSPISTSREPHSPPSGKSVEIGEGRQAEPSSAGLRDGANWI